MAFSVWYVEKEFNVGRIDESFPLMKFLNLVDKDNIQKYNEIQKGDSTSTEGDVKTLR